MSNGIKFTFLLSVILIVMFSMTFAQGVPFQAEVTVSVARMRWGPGPAYVVQHYANLGHVLTVLEADAESDPPWTWYYARTPSGVQSWIRGDLIRRTDAPVPVIRVDAPTGTYPVVDNNLCNDPIFRSCQDGTDHDLWEAGYWANDRYNHWERGGWNLDIVYHQNPCKTDRLCTTRDSWDAGRVEAELLAATATPDVTLTPFGIKVTVEVEVRTVWETFTGTAASLVLGRTGANVYAPPEYIYSGINNANTGTPIGEFRFKSESVRVTCQYWHNTDQDDSNDDLLKSRVFPITKFGENDVVECISDNIRETSVVARQWKITLERTYSGSGEISDDSWTLTATAGSDGDECGDACVKALPSGLQPYFEAIRLDTTERDNANDAPNPGGIENIGETGLTASPTCRGRKTTEGGSSVTRYEHTCDVMGTNLESELKFRFTRTKTGRGLKPTPCATDEGSRKPSC